MHEMEDVILHVRAYDSTTERNILKYKVEQQTSQQYFPFSSQQLRVLFNDCSRREQFIDAGRKYDSKPGPRLNSNNTSVVCKTLLPHAPGQFSKEGQGENADKTKGFSKVAQRIIQQGWSSSPGWLTPSLSVCLLQGAAKHFQISPVLFFFFFFFLTKTKLF